MRMRINRHLVQLDCAVSPRSLFFDGSTDLQVRIFVFKTQIMISVVYHYQKFE